MNYIHLLLTASLSHAIASTVKLVFTHVLYRHGERSPIGSFPNDPYQESIWLNGYEQLLPLGCKQQYHLGKYLGRRYANFLSPYYNASEVYVRSTDKDRALCSAYCNLAGLFPPSEEETWNPKLLWQPIPVHTVSVLDDYLLRPNAKCPARDKLLRKENGPLLEKLRYLYQRLFDFMSFKTGYKHFSVKKAGRVLGLLERQKMFNYSIPSWPYNVWFDPATDTNRTVFDILKDLHRIYKVSMYDSPEKARFASGYLVGTIVNTMKEKMNKQATKKPTKMIIYSAHESTLLGFLNAIHMFNGLIPPIASCVMVELYRDQYDNHYVSVRYKNDSMEAYTLMSPACPHTMCPLETFAASVESISFRNAKERRLACKH